MYMGKDEQGRYNFIDTGRFIMSKEFIEQKSISIDKSFDEDKAFEIYESVKRNTIKRSIKSKGKERQNFKQVGKTCFLHSHLIR